MNRPKKTLLTHSYKNAGGKSEVASFSIEKDAMNVRFKDRSEYRYTNQSASPEAIAKMKQLALAGKGLGTYIKANVADKYQRKIR